MENNEQWLSDGNCDICRKNKYCDNINKPCKAAKRRQSMAIAGMVASAMINVMVEGTNKRPDK